MLKLRTKTRERERLQRELRPILSFQRLDMRPIVIRCDPHSEVGLLLLKQSTVCSPCGSPRMSRTSSGPNRWQYGSQGKSSPPGFKPESHVGHSPVSYTMGHHLQFGSSVIKTAREEIGAIKK